MPLPATAILCILSILPSPSSSLHPTSFLYDSFRSSSPDITFLQGSSISNNAIQLTQTGSINSSGRALFSHPVQFKLRDGSSLSFSTQFAFSIDAGKQGLADGIAFIIVPHASPVENSDLQYIGILNSTMAGRASSHTFAVEFDSYDNPEVEDIDDNHIGVDINDVISYKAVPAAFLLNTEFRNASDGYGVNLKSGRIIKAWIDYDGINKQLNVSVSGNTGLRPPVPLISNNSVDLSDVLQNYMYVGFSASTGFLDDVLYHIHAWSFTNNGTSASIMLSTSKEHSLRTVLTLTITICSVIFLFLAAIFWWRRRRLKHDLEWDMSDINLDNVPHIFSYKELSKATNSFNKEHLLGRGGFGSVYRGVLSGTGIEIAVKRISKESKQGPKEFIAEISSIGRLRHRNLVPLLGWCHRHDLLLVYEFMLNGSLDKFLFTKEAKTLPWDVRVGILTGVAAALLYLHEGWEQKIIHRDVKASNVLLDADFNARLGDFGLARLYEHNVEAQSTNVAGTWGYVAPEYFFTRKATDKTDVYSFGALAIEVASGRKIVEVIDDITLGSWLWDLHQQDKLLQAADPRLMLAYNAEEMKRVLQLGLLCSHPDPSQRPSMRRAWEVLKGDAVLPSLPMSKLSQFMHQNSERDSVSISTETSYSSNSPFISSHPEHSTHIHSQLLFSTSY